MIKFYSVTSTPSGDYWEPHGAEADAAIQSLRRADSALFTQSTPVKIALTDPITYEPASYEELSKAQRTMLKGRARPREYDNHGGTLYQLGGDVLEVFQARAADHVLLCPVDFACGLRTFSEYAFMRPANRWAALDVTGKEDFFCWDETLVNYYSKAFADELATALPGLAFEPDLIWTPEAVEWSASLPSGKVVWKRAPRVG